MKTYIFAILPFFHGGCLNIDSDMWPSSVVSVSSDTVSLVPSSIPDDVDLLCEAFCADFDLSVLSLQHE